MQLLAAGDIAVNDLARAESTLLRAAVPGGDELLRCIAAYDYEGALNILRTSLHTDADVFF